MPSTVMTTNPILSLRESWPWRIAIVAMLAALADWLFFRRVIGISLAIFALAVGVGIVLANRSEASRRERLISFAILIAALLPALEDFNAMSVLIAALGIGAFALGMTGVLPSSLKERIVAVGWYLLSGPFQFFRDLPIIRDRARAHGVPVNLSLAQGWIVPLTLGAVFVLLFAAANPVLANWLMQFRLGDTIKLLDMQRLLFWFGAVVAVWAFVCVSTRFAIPSIDDSHPGDTPAPTLPSLMFNDAVILRSLVLFNLLFAVQTVMDIQYLWAGAALPDGMSYASYAHHGAYPLIATALLAAAFVIIAMRPGSDAERSPLMRGLVFLWVGQNVLLVVSSILRLDLYVATYLLTYWRVAAFIWMLIVAAGLVLIVIRIVTQRSNAWLISANLLLLLLAMYVCSFINFANLVASYNVAHSQDAAGAGRPVDLGYLVALGPQAVPALERYFAAHPTAPYFRRQRDQLAVMHLWGARDWRAWTFRGWRLTRDLEDGPIVTAR